MVGDALISDAQKETQPKSDNSYGSWVTDEGREGEVFGGRVCRVAATAAAAVARPHPASCRLGHATAAFTYSATHS